MQSVGLRTLFVTLVGIAASAQSPPRMQVTHFPGADRAFDLPLVVCSSRSDAARRINTDIQLDYLGGLVSPDDKDPLSALKQAAEKTPNEAPLSYTFTSQSTRRLIGVTIRDVSQSGAYPIYGVESRLYDAIHGQPVTLSDLLTPEGLARFKDRLGDLRRAALKTVFRSEAVAAAKGDQEAAAALRAQKNAATKKELAELGQVLREGDLALSGPTVMVPGPGLGLPHVDVGFEPDLSVALMPKDLAADLTPYGRGLLGRGEMAPLPSTWSRRIFTGTIGASRVVLSLTRQEGIGVQGVYAYLKYRSAITLYGEEDSPGQFRFDEWISSNTPSTGTLRFQCDGWKLEGTWTSGDGARVLPFQASAE